MENVTVIEKAKNWLQQPHFGGVKAEGAIEIIQELVTHLELIGEPMKIETEITEQEIKDAIERKVRVAIADQTNQWSIYNIIKEKVKAAIPSAIDTLIAEVLAGSAKLKQQILDTAEKEIKRKLQVALKMCGE